jgi:rhodanese-related sulfurtransferase
MAREVSVLEAARLVDDGDAVLLDVRDPDEWQALRAPGALHIPMRDLSTSTDRLPKRGLIVCICHVGMRSAIAAEALVGAGYDAANVRGGMDAWETAGLPVERG